MGTEGDNTRRRRSRLGKIAMGTCVLAVIVLVLDVFASYQTWYISAVCPYCLQHAYIREVRLLNIPVRKKTTLSQAHGGLMSSAAFSPGIPSVNPHVYDEILGKRCEHKFARGGFGRSDGLLLPGQHRDGEFFEWQMLLPRIAAIEALFTAYARTGDKSTAATIYGMVATAYPIEIRHGRVQMAREPSRREGGWVDELQRITDRLKAVETPADFAAVRDEIAAKLEPGKAQAGTQ